MKLTNEEIDILILLIDNKLEEIYHCPEGIKIYWKPEILNKLLKKLYHIRARTIDINHYNKNANPLDTLIDFALESGAGAFWVNNAKDELKRLRQIMSKPCLEYDLMKSDTIINKCKDTIYAQHLYASLCNNVFIKDNHQWTCSWRMSGGIVADLRNCGESYIDWYCSGISDNPELMSEGCVSDEIREDLLSLGWTIEPYDCVENNIENI